MHRSARTIPVRFLILWIVVVAAAANTGCSTTRYITVRKEPYNPLTKPLRLVSHDGPQPSDRTNRLLRRFDLLDQYESDPDKALDRLQEEIESEPTDEKIHAFAELAYIRGRRLQSKKQDGAALDRYGAAVAYAYRYLFDEKFDRIRNPYDPNFRTACDLYNESLESALRIVKQRNQLHPGTTHRVSTAKQEYVVDIVVRGRWSGEEIERLEFVSDFDLEDGLSNRHHTYGLGVPLIAVRKQREVVEGTPEEFYPPALSLPMTAFMRVLPAPPGQKPDAPCVHACVLELYDPLANHNIEVANRLVPLETDLTTPLAYFLDNPQFEDRKNVATAGLLDANAAESIKGLFMLEPYDPNKLPVVMVHGLWSSPVTWMEMFNDLRSFPEIRERYQFWFYLYPSGQPFWVSATQMRADLAHARQVLDPQHQTPALDQMTLVGHSMGGLVSLMQVIESRDDFWKALSDKPFDELKASPEDREQLANMLFFHANPSIKRVITIGTPHRGSEFANDYTRWLGRAVIKLPSFVTKLTQRVIRENPGYFHNTEMLTISTSIDSLAPDSPLLPVLLRGELPPWVQHHNVVGLVPGNGLVSRLSGNSDGIVSFESAHLDKATSEITVPSDHMTVHRHPRATLEVRRVLLDQLAVLNQRSTALADARSYPPSGQSLSPPTEFRPGGTLSSNDPSGANLSNPAWPAPTAMFANPWANAPVAPEALPLQVD